MYAQISFTIVFVLIGIFDPLTSLFVVFHCFQHLSAYEACPLPPFVSASQDLHIFRHAEIEIS